MHVDKMKLCTRVVAPSNTVEQDTMTGKAYPTDEVNAWMNHHGIWDGELVFENEYVYYFANEQDAVMFTLRWS